MNIEHPVVGVAVTALRIVCLPLALVAVVLGAAMLLLLPCVEVVLHGRDLWRDL